MRKGHRETDCKGRPAKAAKTGTRGIRGIADYHTYHLRVGEFLKYLGLYGILDLSVSYLFFNSWIAFLLLLPGAAVFLHEEKASLQRKRARLIQIEFLDGIQTVAGSLQAGYSVENAFREAVRELSKMYEWDSFIMQEFGLIAVQIDRNQNVEDLLMDLGRRSGVEDIRSFAEIFLTAKRSGGDLLAIIRNTVSCIRQKQETMQEIETCLSGKVMEQNVMSMMPVLILAYVKLTSPEFLDVMYGNVTGTAVMTVCFGIYLASFFWGKSIVRIEV